ncbi:MAG: DnaB-like helicase N-terminal domain-containing protein [Prevotella sp.]|nr:DnaB-like helicase N-terminal domain-containing protein [Prevotella sp.]
MKRRQQIERIIIGTLLNSDENLNYFNSVKSSVTKDMFTDDRNKKLYDIIVRMNQSGITRTWPDAIFEYQNRNMPADMVAYMVELAVDWYFLAKKINYNECVWMFDDCKRKRYTYVTFDDYVTRLIQMALKDGKQKQD